MSVKFTKYDFIQESIKIHGDKYDYSLVDYKNMRTNIKIICKKHGVFVQRPDIHLSKKGCKDCLVYERGVNTFLEKVSNIHGDKYRYDLSNYVNRTIKIKIICKEHGEFSQTPHQHLLGKGCYMCNGGISSNINVFIKNAHKIHGDKYDYSKSVYINSIKSIIIICKEHGDFSQRPNNHIIKGYGCPKCGEKFGIKENKWLDSLNISERQFRIGRYVVDGYDPDTKTIYEFNGDFWHGNPDIFKKNDYNNVLKRTFGELYEKTLKKEIELKKMGYRVISIWENDFNKL